ncbi:MAG: HAD hydrolase-like protein [Clostridia bacterium]|nr:HAD hydrolase-like protein [Clostridia bacterium]
MPQPTHCFFDLDGTITDSAPGITGSVRYALEKMNIPIPDGLNLNCFIGPPLLYGFSAFCGLNEADAARAVELYRENYRAGGMFECHVYDGIREMLDELSRRGVTLVLATCKPHEFATKILEKFELLHYFRFVSGPEMDGTRNTKHEVIAHAMEQLGIDNPQDILMIGDRADDVIGAQKNGIGCAGVLWGFGSREELEAAGAVALPEVPHQIIDFFNAESDSWRTTK